MTVKYVPTDNETQIGSASPCFLFIVTSPNALAENS